MHKLKIYKDYASLSSHVADEIISLVQRKPQAVLCMASGDSPRLTCQLVVERARELGADFSQCTFIGLDEWVGVRPENEGSCSYFFHQLLIAPLRFYPSQFHLFNAFGNLDDECKKMDGVIKQRKGIDLMIVGVGMNGHIGFNEPGVPVTLYSHAIDLDATTISVGQKYFKSDTPLQKGITLGLQHLMESNMAIVMANGSKKAEIIRKTLKEEVTPSVPATIIRRHPNGFVMIDEEAAALLSR